MHRVELRRVALICCAGLVALTAAGCHGQSVAEHPLPTTPSAGPPAQDPGRFDVIGETVTVRGTVTHVIGPTSFELDSPGYGDRSLLVVCDPAREVAPGARVEVSGNVQKFGYDWYADEYDLTPQPSAYAEFDAELFLVGAKAMDLS